MRDSTVVSFRKSANFSAFSHGTFSLLQYDKYCQSYKRFNLLKLGRSCGLTLRLSANSIFDLHKTSRTGKTII